MFGLAGFFYNMLNLIDATVTMKSLYISIFYRQREAVLLAKADCWRVDNNTADCFPANVSKVLRKYLNTAGKQTKYNTTTLPLLYWPAGGELV